MTRGLRSRGFSTARRRAQARRRQPGGGPALIAEVPPLADPTLSHDMGPAHREQAEQELEALRQKARGLKQEAGVLEKEAETPRDQVDP